MHEHPPEFAAGFLESSTSKPIRVLHVDDEISFQQAVKECLQMQGAFEVDCASSVAEALEKMKNNVYDAVICDYKMPLEDGLQFLEKLRKSGNNIPFIIFTGKGRGEVAVKALNLGADGYISKNGDPETVYCELAHNIRQAVERRRAERRLRLSEAKYRALFENAYMCIVLLDLQGRIIDVNNVVLNYGFKKEQLIGRYVVELVPPRYRSRIIRELAEKAKGKPTEAVVEIETPKGRVIAEYRSKPLIIDDKVVGIQVILEDITKREEQERLYRTVFENTGTAMCIIEADGTISMVNRQFENSAATQGGK
ncbi:response regulator [Candidatus Bathyarchaeota archaeon]|nr:response regulator [Candidatus Bathyarchaeota archaeon]